MEYIWMIWIALSIICLIIEINSGDFFVCCFAIGALGGMVAALCDSQIWIQILVWAAVSMLSLLFIRPALLRKFHESGEKRVSNADALIGREGRVIADIPADGYGYVKIDGDEWRSVSQGVDIPKGTKVSVISRESIVLTVEQLTVNS